MRYKAKHWNVSHNDVEDSHRANRRAVIEEVQQVLNTSFVVLDTETTGLTFASFHDIDTHTCSTSVTRWYGAEVCELAVIDSQGNTLIDTLIRIQETIDPAASAIHHIDAALLAAPDVLTFADVYHTQLVQLLTERTLVFYNAPFDLKMLQQTAYRYDVPFPALERLRTYDVQQQFAVLRGKALSSIEVARGETYRLYSLEMAAKYLHVPIPAVRHRALDDARLTLQVLQALAHEKL